MGIWRGRRDKIGVVVKGVECWDGWRVKRSEAGVGLIGIVINTFRARIVTLYNKAQQLDKQLNKAGRWKRRDGIGG